MGIKVSKKIDRDQELRDFVGLPNTSEELRTAEKSIAQTDKMVRDHEWRKYENKAIEKAIASGEMKKMEAEAKALTEKRRRGTSAPYGSI